MFIFLKKCSRRSFLKKTAGILFFIFFGVPVSYSALLHKFLRPPGSVDDKRFSERCNGCGKCIGSCPRHIIVFSDIKQGFLSARQPTVTFKKDYCDFCMKCSFSCPFGAILPAKKEGAVIGIAVIVKDSCVAWDWEGCVICVEKCPEKAIELDDMKRPYVLEEKCNGCGICELECPALSLRSTNKKIKGVVVMPSASGGLL